MPEKVRLDVLLHDRNLAPSREAARRMIMAGTVRIDGEVRDKPGQRVPRDVSLEVQQAPRFVSRGGEKLAGALEAFPVDVFGRICADVGASTGGFTDCLLQNGAERVYAIDVGYGQLDFRLRSDARVAVMERTNARYIERLDEPVSLVVMDASFISLRLLLPAVKGWLMEDADVITLVKPQFEAGKEHVGKGGVVRDATVHRRVLEDVLTAAQAEGYVVRGVTVSPLKGPAGNIEFLAWLSLEAARGDGNLPDLEEMIAAALDAGATADEPGMDVETDSLEE